MVGVSSGMLASIEVRPAPNVPICYTISTSIPLRIVASPNPSPRESGHRNELSSHPSSLYKLWCHWRRHSALPHVARQHTGSRADSLRYPECRMSSAGTCTLLRRLTQPRRSIVDILVQAGCGWRGGAALALSKSQSHQRGR
jgi:hypothetical protein